jgi:hypothetical protein
MSLQLRRWTCARRTSFCDSIREAVVHAFSRASRTTLHPHSNLGHLSNQAQLCGDLQLASHFTIGVLPRIPTSACSATRVGFSPGICRAIRFVSCGTIEPSRRVAGATYQVRGERKLDAPAWRIERLHLPARPRHERIIAIARRRRLPPHRPSHRHRPRIINHHAIQARPLAFALRPRAFLGRRDWSSVRFSACRNFHDVAPGKHPSPG